MFGLQYTLLYLCIVIKNNIMNRLEFLNKVGLGYLNLRRMVSEVAARYNLTFNFDENVNTESDKILKQKATKFTKKKR